MEKRVFKWTTSYPSMCPLLQLNRKVSFRPNSIFTRGRTKQGWRLVSSKFIWIRWQQSTRKYEIIQIVYYYIYNCQNLSLIVFFDSTTSSNYFSLFFFSSQKIFNGLFIFRSSISRAFVIKIFIQFLTFKFTRQFNIF